MDEHELPLLTPGGLVPALNPTLVTDGAGLDKVRNYFKRISEQPSPEFAADYESNITPTFVDRTARVLALGDKNEQYVIDFLHFAGSTEKLIAGQGRHLTSSWAKPIIDVVEPAFNSNAFLKIGQRFDFEYEVSSWNFGMALWNTYSTDIAEKIIWAGLHTFKDVNFYSLAGMTARYFGVKVDKTEQKGYDLETLLTEKQIIYSCFDLRIPIAIRAMQLPVLEEQGLVRITGIENDAQGFFDDIHLHGWNTDRTNFAALIDEWTAKYQESIKHLDTHFLPVVGPKIISEENLDPILAEWKDLTVDSADEIALKESLKATKDKVAKAVLRVQIADTAAARKVKAAEARKRYMALRSSITANKKIADKCEGEAAINYGSGAQLLKAMRQMKGFNTTNLPTTDDGVLEKLRSKPVVAALRDYRTYAKLLETYGKQWITEFTTNPSAEEGWVNPGTGKIHSTINQLEAETGRTSSVKPNIQNLPHDPRVRACFVADPPNEDIRISTCCEDDTLYLGLDKYRCCKCGQECETKAEEYVIVTCDMSGAELRIIAEESGSIPWQTAFNNGWDVHSCGTETLYPEEWPSAALPGCKYFERHFVESLGREEDHQKCKCPAHMELRDGNKATNFLLAYGGGPAALGDAIGKSEDEASALMKKHEAANPEVWAYLEESGKQAVRDFQSRSRSGRLRRFRKPDWDTAKEKAKERMFESLKKKDKLTLPDGSKLKLEDMHPENWQIRSSLKGMHSSIERKGKNFKIQELNATIFKRAAGCGFDKDGKPYLWHILKTLKGKAKNMVHDEAVVQFPKRFGAAGLAAIQDAFKRAGAEFLTKVVMESEGRVETFWKK